MHWYLFLPIFLVVSTHLVTESSAQIGRQGFERYTDVGERDKRIPYYYPLRQNMMGPPRAVEEPDMDDDEGFDRKRRTPFFYANPRFWGPSRYAEEEDFDMDDDEGFDRKRRIPYYYPRFGLRQNFYEEEPDDVDEKRSLKKRAGPFMNPDELDARKRFADDKKRSLKRSLSETLENDDISDFGYDKRSPVDDNDDKKKKKRLLLKKRVVA